MLGTGIRDRVNDRLDNMETVITDAANSLRRMAVFVVAALAAMLLIVAVR